MINPCLIYCQCGQYSFEPSLWMRLIMLLRGSYTVTCPQCQARMRIIMVHHEVCIERKNNMNKEIWQNG